MGYYSDLAITITSTADVKDFDEIDKAIREISGINNWTRESEGCEFSIESNAKWYNHRKFAQHLSSCYPDVEFQVHRRGEGVNEEWDEERYKVKAGNIYDEEVRVIRASWEKRTEEEKVINESLDREMRRLRDDVGRGI